MDDIVVADAQKLGLRFAASSQSGKIAGAEEEHMPSRVLIIAGAVVVLAAAGGGFYAWRHSEAYDISVATSPVHPV